MRHKSTGVTCGNGKILSVLTGIGLALAPGICQAQATYNISTIAGTPGTGGYSGDGGPANTAQLNGPCALAVDNAGNLYIADSLNFRVREMAIGGNINTVVGTGTAGDTTGTATSSQIRNPCGLLLDRSGNLYVADTTNHEVKKVSGGALSKIAGTGTAGFSLDGNPAVNAQLNNPTGLALNAAGVLFIADTYNQRVRHIDTSGIIQTVVNFTGTQGYLGDGGAAIAAELNNPQGLAMDAAGNLYIADTDNGVIRKVPPDFSTISTVAGNGTNGYSGDGGPATQAQLSNPKDVAVDAAGNLYIADTTNCRIRVVTPDGIIHTVAGNGTPGYGGDGGAAAAAQLKFPASVKVDSGGNVYIADFGNQVIRQLTPVPTGPPSVSGVQSSSLFGFGGSSAVAPGSWIEVQGSNLAGVSRSWLLADFNGVVAPTSLELTSVTIGGQPAAIASISPTMLLVQVPSQVAPGSQSLVVQTAVGMTSPFTVTVNALQPGVYAPAFLLVGVNQYTSEFNDFMEWVLPTGASAGTSSRPARAGDFIVVWGVGFGPVTPNVPTGTIVQGLTTLTTPVQFSIGGVPATVLYQGLAPGEIGLYQFDLVVPNNVAAGNLVPLTFTQGGVSGTQTLYVAIQP
jgi:uncharacterized protein (TIGR03437 family)